MQDNFIFTNITVGISCCIKKTVLTNVLKRKRIAKQNVIFSLEVRSRLEILRALAIDLNIFLFIEQCFA